MAASTAPDAAAAAAAATAAPGDTGGPAFSFPLLPDADLIARLAPLGVTLTPALLDKPTPEFARAAFETLLVALAGVSRCVGGSLGRRVGGGRAQNDAQCAARACMRGQARTRAAWLCLPRPQARVGGPARTRLCACACGRRRAREVCAASSSWKKTAAAAAAAAAAETTTALPVMKKPASRTRSWAPARRYPLARVACPRLARWRVEQGCPALGRRHRATPLARFPACDARTHSTSLSRTPPPPRPLTHPPRPSLQ